MSDTKERHKYESTARVATRLSPVFPGLENLSRDRFVPRRLEPDYSYRCTSCLGCAWTERKQSHFHPREDLKNRMRYHLRYGIGFFVFTRLLTPLSQALPTAVSSLSKILSICRARQLYYGDLLHGENHWKIINIPMYISVYRNSNIPDWHEHFIIWSSIQIPSMIWL